MGKFLVGVILGALVAGNANASIISRSFLDEALTDYATNTALDLKANQSDFTDLSNIVGTPAELTYRDIMASGSSTMADLMGGTYYDSYADNTVPTNNISELINLNYTDINFPGLAGVVHSLFWQRKRDDMWPTRLADIFDDYGYLFSMGYRSFTDKIGTLETKIAWPEDLDVPAGIKARQLFRVDLSDVRYPEDATAKDVLEVLFRCNGSPGSSDACFDYMADSILYGAGLSEEFASSLPEDLKNLTRHKGLLELTKDVSTLPTSIAFYEYDANGTLGYTKYPTAEVFGINNNIGGMLAAILQGFSSSGHRLLSLSEISTRTLRLSDQIGTLPTLVGFCEYDAGGTLVCAKYPTAEVFGVNDNIGGMLAAILHGFSDGSGHEFLSLPEVSTRTLRLSDQIGTLPDGYETVGAALTAMDAKIDARELPSTSEDGQYVLSAKKVGDTITYTWVRMDLTSEEQAQ